MKRWKKASAIGLAASLAINLCACGLGKGDNPFLGKGTRQDPALAKEFVYSLQEYDLGDAQGKNSDNYIQKAVAIDGRLYLLLRCYGGDDVPVGGGAVNRLVSMNQDGTDVKSCILQSAVEGAEEDREGAPAKKPATNDVNQPLPDADADDVQDAAPDAVADDNADAAPDIDAGFGVDIGTEMYETRYEYMDFNNFLIVKPGFVYGVKNYVLEDYSDPENPISLNQNFVCSWNLDGEMLWEKELGQLRTEDTWMYVNGLVGYDDGTVAAWIDGDQTGRVMVDPNGEVSAMKPITGLESIRDRLNGWTILTDGTLLISYQNDNWTQSYLATYDFLQDRILEEYELPSQMSYLPLNGVIVNEQNEFYYSANQNVYKYRLGASEAEQVMSFVNSDLTIDNLNNIIPIDDDHFIGWYSVYGDQRYNSTVGGGMFTGVAPEDIPDKEVLMLAGTYLDGNLRKRVVEYNKKSSEYRIVMKDYSEYNTMEDYTASFTQLNNDIISGNMPDILMVDGYNMSVENYASKGLLADIDKLIASDEELSGKEYMENVFDACRIGGKLYEIVPTFAVNTYIAKKSIVGDRTALTMEEAREYLNGMPDGARMFGDLTREDFFSIVMNMCGNDFVDVSSGKCKFDSPEFISLMEYGKTLPENVQDEWDESWYARYQSQYRENRTLLASCYIGSPRDLVYQLNGMFGEDVSFVGFPNSAGQGSVINTYNTFVLSAKSANLNAAWDFMRYYLTDEYQDTLEWQMPVAKKQFDEFAKKAMSKPFYLDENGNKVEYDDSYWMNDEEIILPPLTQEQLDQVTAFIKTVNKRSYFNVDVNNIISEEMDAFYKGQKSAEEVASVIQSRAKIYVSENR